MSGISQEPGKWNPQPRKMAHQANMYPELSGMKEAERAGGAKSPWEGELDGNENTLYGHTRGQVDSRSGHPDESIYSPGPLVEGAESHMLSAETSVPKLPLLEPGRSYTSMTKSMRPESQARRTPGASRGHGGRSTSQSKHRAGSEARGSSRNGSDAGSHASHTPSASLHEVPSTYMTPAQKAKEAQQAIIGVEGDEVMAAIQTSDDVIEYYVRNGHMARVKLFHLNRANVGEKFDPYALDVVPRDSVDDEHFTISASGVVHVSPGAQSEFTPLGEWMRDQSIFKLLTQMRFFKYYLVNKMFKYWRTNVRHKLYMQVRAMLMRKLFLAKPTFCASLMELRGLVHEVSEVQLLHLDLHNHVFELEKFAEMQSSEQKIRAAPKLEHLVEVMVQKLEKLAREVVTQERQYRASVEGEAEGGYMSGAGLGQKSRSMVAIKQERIERLKTYKRIAEEAKMLGSLVRLVDYMLVEALVGITIRSAEEMLDHLENGPRQKGYKGLINTTLSFTDSTVQFQPTEMDVIRVVNGTVVEGMMQTLGSVPRFLTRKPFSNLFTEKITGPVPVAILQNTPHFLDLHHRMEKSITTSFNEAAAYAEVFEDHRVVFEFGKTWDVASYEAEARDAQQFRKDMMVQKEWKMELERMKTNNVVGVLVCDSRNMRSGLQAITLRTLDAMKGLLLVAARDECLRVLDNFNQRIKSLADRPMKLDDFAAYQERHLEMAANKKHHMAEAAVVDEMYDMLHHYEMKVPMADQVKLDDLHDSAEALRTALEDGDGFIDERKAGMVSTLEKNIAEMNEQLLQMLGDMHTGQFVTPESEPREVVADLDEMEAKILAFAGRAETYKKYQALFKMQQDEFGNLSLTQKELGTRKGTWSALFEWGESTHEWMHGKVDGLNLEEINNTVDSASVRSYKMFKSNREDGVVKRFRDEVESFKQYMPLLQELANPALEARHWEAVFKVLGKPYHKDMEFCISDLIQLGVMDKLEAVENIGTTASKEYSLRKALEKMVGEWDGLEFGVRPYKDTGTFILIGTDEIQTILDDQIVKVQSMNASPFAKPFKEQSSEWEQTMMTLQDMLDNWLKCQSTWLYLEPIFSSEDIMKQMPEEGEKFLVVDSMWRDIMGRTEEAPEVIPIARDRDRLDKLVECNGLLDAIQKGLAAYLEKKRLFFPRFFFLSNDEMLEILSETKDPLRVQPHLKKCFEGVDKLQFEKNLDISAMCSVEKEAVPFKQPFINPNAANGAVEKWLLQVEAGMLEAVHDQTDQSVKDYAETAREKWVLNWPGMVVLVVTAIYWTKGVEEAIASGGGELARYEELCTAQLMNIVELVRGELTKLQRATLGALVVMDVHARDVVTNMVKTGVVDVGDFDWQSQLRSYWEDDTTMLRMMSAVIEYGYEYLGNSSRLVITPLTDRCYRTLMGAIHLTLGGAPEGPAGTGKTETTKDLAKALARQCVVFNCSDSLDYIAMGKFFKGLASSGAWACFDEFNRIDLEVLSVVAQQVLDIQRAIAANVKTFVFEGTEIGLKVSAWCSITMNPGYAGRSELPDNLKALFRTVAMMVPDYAMISEIILYSFGYLEARSCAQKIVATYRLCSEQLSSQDHYDYGMRAVMAVLRAAGNLKRRYPEENEFVLMLRSIIDVNLCKFLSQDVPLFNGIVSDLFPGVVLPKPDYTHLEKAIKDNCEKLNLQATDYFMLKVIQLYEMIVVRHGLMIVGLPFSGKSCSYRVLQGALTDMHHAGQEESGGVITETHCLNPKSITMGQLYGQFDPVSHEWSDGVLAVTFRGCASDPSPHRKWLIFDGPVDAIWIENMNTVLDDNKKLCLMNSEIIQMSAVMSMVFEVMDLAVASPATVSRCGMVYLEPHQLGWRPLTLSWLDTLPKSLKEEHRKHLLGLFDWILPASLKFLRREVREAAPTQDANLVMSLQRMFVCMTDEFSDEEKFAAMDDDLVMKWVDFVFLFSYTWTIAATGATAADRTKMDNFLRAQIFGTVEDNFYKVMIPEEHVSLVVDMVPNDEGTELFDYFFDKEECAWKTWQVTTEEIPETAQFREIIVPTVDTTVVTFLLDTTVHHDVPIMFVGPTGTGKSVYVQRHLMTGLDQDKFVPNFVSFSARTSANMTQFLIDARLDKRRKGVYGPPMGKKCIVFVDDLNMPQLETYGAQPPIELLRQFMDHGGWYDRDNAFRNMVDTQFVTAMGPPGGGRNPITARYSRHFAMVSIVDFKDSTLSGIFSTIMKWFLDTRGFPNDVKALQASVIDATMEVYKTAIKNLLPTPSKSHYVFNLRDFSRVVQGMLLQKSEALKGDNIKSPVDSHIRLWVHEVMRIFYDRLVDEKDREWFLEFIKKMTESHFKKDFNKLFEHLDADSDGVVDAEELRRLFFGNYMNADEDDMEKRLYEEIQDVPKLIAQVEDYLTDYNGESKSPMNLAMFLYAVEHISRICRVLIQPGSHMLLVGVGGSGRQSLSRLAAYMCQMETFQIAISKSYTSIEWRDDLKSFMRKSGAEDKHCVFVFSDTQIKLESFVEDINNMLNSGEVPNMFAVDEKAAVMEQTRVLAKKKGKILETPTELWAYFVESCKQNLHIVLCFSPIGDAFRERLRQFPSLVNCCTIDWFQEWPNDALEAVAVKFLKEVDLTEKERSSLMNMCKTFHTDVRELSLDFLASQGRYNYVTPTSYLELLNLYTTLLRDKRTEISDAKQRYLTGLEKLDFTAKQVEVMQQELTALKPNLIKTVGETEELMAKVSKEKSEVVEPKKAIVDSEVAEAQKQGDAAKAIRDECEEVLAEAVPVLESALAALDTLKPADIKLVQSFKNPPATVKLVMEAVCVLLDIKPARVQDPSGSGKKIDDFWEPAKKLLADSNFMNMLKGYDKDNIHPRIIDNIRKNYIVNPDFTPQNAAKASSAAEGLCKWACAMDQYDKVAKIVAPKRLALAEAEASFNAVMEGLQKKQAELQELMDKLAVMEKQLSDSMTKKEHLENEVELCTQKLERAEKLITGLGGEKARWGTTADELGVRYTNLTGDMIISAGMLSYLGAFTMAFRERVAGQWVNECKKMAIPSSPVFSLIHALGDPVKVREWTIAGLPNDSFSIDNGIMVSSARRWPLMIDPQGQANKWVKNMEKAHNLQVVKLTDSDYLRTLENAIQFGLPVLLENVGEELDPSLEPLLLKQIFKQGGVNCIKLGDAIIEYSDSFRFYITTTLRNPHYLPETAVKVTLLNFMITLDGLSDQLLGVVVVEERPDLEEQRSELVIQSAENKKKLQEIEDKILHVLSSSEGNILEDATAIQILGDAKVVSDEINAKQKVAEVTEREIDEARAHYQPCGAYNAVLFFCIADMANIDPMYQYSLTWFNKLFVRSINDSEKIEDVSKRLTIINDHFTYSLYLNVCRSLFEKDKLLFAFLLMVRILASEKKMDMEEYKFLLTGGVGVGGGGEANPAPEWLTDKAWAEIGKLGKDLGGVFSSFPGSFAAAIDDWKHVYDNPDPHKMDLPGKWKTELSGFQKLLVLRCMRPDKVVPGVQDFVAATMGQRFIEPPPFDLPGSFKESSVTNPLLFVLSPGSDPTAALLKFADDVGFGASKVIVISMGQGQGPKAARMIEEATASGGWVLLQNCHLAASWMPALEKICEGIKPESVESEFRLWMTSYPSPAFPVSILQNSVKMTNEPPTGIRANLKRSYGLDPILDEEWFEGCKKGPEFKKLLFGLCFIHAYVQERRKFGALGWNISYGFDDGDLRISARQLQMYLNDADEVPFAALKYATGECNYGGRVTDDKDRRLLNTILERVYSPELLEEGSKLSASGLYHAPVGSSREEHLEYINSLPIVSKPEAFGLHDNADIQKDQADTAQLFTSLIKTGGSSSSGGGGKSDEELVGDLVKDILGKLPPLYDIEKAQKKYPVLYEESMNQVLCQEMLRYNRLLKTIRDSLLALEKAVQGLLVMSSDLEKVFRAMAVGMVPDMWKGKSFPSLKPLGSYVVELLDRLKLLQDWYEDKAPPVFWISGFYFTPAFTTAALQNFARKNNLPIDTVGFDFEMMDIDHTLYDKGPEDGIYVYGFFLDGCAWDEENKKLCESVPKMLYVPAPVIWLKPKLLTDMAEYDHYECPVYRTAERKGTLATTGHSTNFLMYVRVPTDRPQYHWTMRAVCMLCSLPE